MPNPANPIAGVLKRSSQQVEEINRFYNERVAALDKQRRHETKFFADLKEDFLTRFSPVAERLCEEQHIPSDDGRDDGDYGGPIVTLPCYSGGEFPGLLVRFEFYRYQSCDVEEQVSELFTWDQLLEAEERFKNES